MLEKGVKCYKSVHNWPILQFLEFKMSLLCLNLCIEASQNIYRSPKSLNKNLDSSKCGILEGLKKLSIAFMMQNVSFSLI